MKEIMTDSIFGKNFCNTLICNIFFAVLELSYFELPTNPQINRSRLAGIHIILMLKQDK